MIIQFDIPNPLLLRLSEVIHLYGYAYNAELPGTDTEQKEKYLKKMTAKYWEKLLSEGEAHIARQNAVNNLPNPSMDEVII